MILNNRFVKALSSTDLVVIFFYIFMIVLNLVYYASIDKWYILAALDILIIAIVFYIANKEKVTENKTWINIHSYYVIPLIFLSFKEVYILLEAIHHFDYDYLLISADRFLFGTDPTHFLYQIANPVLTEILQIAYGTFFFLPIILGVEYQLKNDYQSFNFIIFLIVLGFFLSYVGYFILPAVGPRFTLHDFSETNTDLPGIFFTNILREIVNYGESIPHGTPNPIDLVQRDVFPSGHTQMTLLVMYLAVKLKSNKKWFFIIDGTLLIFSTVYLRYHYVTDLLGGLVFMLITISIAKPLYNWWQKKTDNSTFEFK